MSHLIEQGAEIHFTTDRSAFPADRVEILDSGWVLAYNTRAYEKEYLPPHKIDGIYTHTADDEDAEWWP